MKKALDYLTAKPARFFLLAALIWGVLMCYLNSIDVGENGFSWHDLLVEANGMVFDLLVFGVLLSIYEALREKKEEIKRLHEEIDDYRGWDEKEAKYRILGAIKRLDKLGVSKINLSSCFLSEANLQGANLQKAWLWGVDFQRAILIRANLEEAVLLVANLQETNLVDTNLQGTNLKQSYSMGAKLWRADLRGANLADANFTAADFWEANLQGANLQGVCFCNANLVGAEVGIGWLENLEEWEVVGWEEILEKYLIDETGKLQLK